MARIRSIKPEFWTDEKIARLPGDTALFFIGLWSHADDHGYFPSSSSALALLLPRYRPQVVQPMLSRLEIEGLVRVSRGAGVGLIVGWHHQKIKERRASKWSDKEIVWDEIKIAAPKPPKSAPGVDRMGEERSGSSSGVQAPPLADDEIVAVTPLRIPRKKPETPTRETWDAYSAAYLAKHGAEPKRNATTNSQMAAFVRRIGTEEAPLVAAFYLTHNDWLYVKNKHSVGMLLRDAEKLRTEWATGSQVTSGQARQAEVKANVIDVWGPLIAEAERKQREGA